MIAVCSCFPYSANIFDDDVGVTNAVVLAGFLPADTAFVSLNMAKTKHIQHRRPHRDMDIIFFEKHGGTAVSILAVSSLFRQMRIESQKIKVDKELKIRLYPSTTLVGVNKQVLNALLIECGTCLSFRHRHNGDLNSGTI